ncbi:GNAT family N-acetyltransferase [Vibrio campbellii]|uniref:N-acetyltransferase domain-containing protein n=1 Tax=Vibrio campbellii (strain ATCC BAA-1116) TaxID=2902295 RepID=A7N2E8_VIBC1|nr:GNAT family N-acetyltransferase [Vibrio campbellii]ABU73167.1 hypothetical protein VIBHAR_05261 [Vibrio campbellii ATCC BAA-1116]MBT0121506.1 GNAT family N-acetyltransferase [Vibrio campbellii]MBT0136643.1 GNAT family N-acetyltransferase [Vibrio campbellii]MBT0141299.1 GNAT family N-acetyltransferase [Vibrio campbellii]MBT0145997.1 GNAT family N-acetyltransferase [Vibrio campbellii]
MSFSHFKSPHGWRLDLILRARRLECGFYGALTKETVIGLLAFCHEDEPLDYSIYWLFRFMIDKDHQNKGYGKQVLSLLVEEVKQLGGKTLFTMHKPSNQQAGKLYRAFGFQEDGILDDGDISLRLELS